jgi:hypothetical protein
LNKSNYDQSALFEHRFWLQVLGDHSRFMLNALSPVEMETIQAAAHFIHVFDQLLQTARNNLSYDEILVLNQQAFVQANEIRNLKLNILCRQLQSDIAINLPPTFINHMVNEVDEYLRILHFLIAGELPPACHPLHYHLLWLPDASGHAITIANLADPVEKKVSKTGEEYSQLFDAFYIKATELAGFLRSNLDQFPALSRFNQEVELEIKLFTRFLNEIEELELDDRLLGTLMPLMPDHMAREECYYLIKLSQVSEVAAPDCDPTKPRTE